MSDAAQETATEAPAEEAPQDGYILGVEPDPELPNFNLFEEDGEEAAPVEAKEEPSGEEVKRDESWSSKIKKDRDQRKKEIELKKREELISEQESQFSSNDELRKSFLANPEAFLEAQGIDPIDFYADWTNRLAGGSTEMGSDLRISETERELASLKEELKQRDGQQLRRQAEARQQDEINKYHVKIDTFMRSEDAGKFPLTVSQCSPEDIAQGIGAYYQETGVELSFDEAFEKVENGLMKREKDIFNDPDVIAKFKKYHGLDASNTRGRRSQLTLSNTLQTQPTKTPAEDMTDDEVYDFWKGKLFT